MLLVPLVPHAHVEDDTGEESTFCDAEEEADGEKPGKVLGDAHKGTNDTPCEGESRKPKSGAREFEDDVSGDLEQDVTDEVDGQRGEVLVSGWIQTMMIRVTLAVLRRKIRTHVQICDKTLDTGVPN